MIKLGGQAYYDAKKELSRIKIKKIRDRRLGIIQPIVVQEEPVYASQSILTPPTIVVMATFPPRKEGMLRVVNQLLPQCDKMCIYLNGYDSVPEELPKSDKLELILAGPNSEHPDISSKAKHHWLDIYPDSYYLTVDDDINYPDDYCEKMVSSIEKYGRKAIICCHGARYKVKDGSIPSNSLARAHKIYYPYQRELKQDTIIHEPGNGCSGSHPKSIGLTSDCSIGDLHSGDDGDIGLFSQRNRVPVVCIKRCKEWLTPMPDVWPIGAQHMDIDKVKLQSDKARSWTDWKLFPVIINPSINKITDKTIAISMPTFNTPRELLVKAVESVLNQTHKDLLLYVCNDSQDPECWIHLKDINDDRLIKVQMPDNNGPYYCHDWVIKNCECKWFSPVDSDDYLSNNRFEILSQYMNDYDVILGGYTAVKGDKHTQCIIRDTPYSNPTEPNLKFLGVSWAGGIWSTKWLYSVGDINGSFICGYDSALQSLAIKYSNMKVVEDYGYYYVWHKNSLTHSRTTGFQSNYRNKVKKELDRRLGLCTDLLEDVKVIMQQKLFIK